MRIIRRKERNRDRKVDKMMMTMTMANLIKRVKVVHNWHETTQCATVVERKVTAHQNVQ